jgi:hypothetical protein
MSGGGGVVSRCTLFEEGERHARNLCVLRAELPVLADDITNATERTPYNLFAEKL